MKKPFALDKLLPAAIFLALLCGAVSSADAAGDGILPMRPATSPPPQGARIVNGVLTHLYPSTVALLKGASATAAESQCTGTLIGCETVLVAAHCVEGDPTPSQYFVFLQHAGIFPVSSVALHPSFSFPVADVAVLGLGTPVTGIAPTVLNVTANPPTGMAGTITGFGRSGGSNDDYGIKRTGAVTIAPCTVDASNPTSVCWDFTDPVGAPGADSNTCNGDSGGPLFLDYGCGDTVAGITSGGTSGDCTGTDHSYDANVFHYLSFIQSQGGADLNNRTCGAMPQVGDAGVVVNAASGDLDSGTQQQTHSFTVPMGTDQLRVALNGHDNGGNDYDIYVRAGSPPTTSLFDCKADGSSMFGYCEIAAPTPGTWYVLVDRSSGAGTYQITATTFPSGLPGPGSDGQTCNDLNSCTSPDVCASSLCTSTPVMNGTPCSDGSACTTLDDCQAGACSGTAQPLTMCKTTTAPGKALIFLKDSLVPTQDRLLWKWSHGAMTSSAEFGTPTTTTDYELCIFEESGGTPALFSRTTIPSGIGWGTTTSGFKFKNKSTGSGIHSIILKAGAAGAARITVKGKGANLAMPTLPLSQDPTVTVQLTNGTTCWEAQYSTNIYNSTEQFKAKGD